MPYITFKNEDALYHAEKGSTWSNHKYIRIENGRYIYPEDLKGNQKSYQTSTKNDNGGSIKKSSTLSGANEINQKSYQTPTKNDNGGSIKKSSTQYQIDYIEDTKRKFESTIQYNNDELAYYKERAEKRFNKNKKTSVLDVSTELYGLEGRAEITAKSTGIYLLNTLKDNKLSEETKTACSKYAMQKMLSQFSVISSTYRDIVNKTSDGTPGRAETISEIYKEFKKLYEKISNANSFSKEDLDEFDDIVRKNGSPDWANKN